MRGLPILLVLSGCDLAFGIDHLAAPPDARPTSCAHGAAFGPPEVLDVGSTFSAESVRLNVEQTLAFLALAEVPQVGPVDYKTSDLYFATVEDGRIQGHNRFGGLSSATYDSYPTLTKDGDHMIFGSRRDADTQKLVLATATDHSFDDATVTVLDLAAGEANEPYALGNSDVLYFAAGPTYADIYRASGGPAEFMAVRTVDGVDTSDRENAPVVSEDELEIFFSSNRADPSLPSLSGLDIYTATRPSADDPFAPPTLLSSLSTGDIDYATWLSPDNCDLYYIQKDHLVGKLFRVRR